MLSFYSGMLSVLMLQWLVREAARRETTADRLWCRGEAMRHYTERVLTATTNIVNVP